MEGGEEGEEEKVVCMCDDIHVAVPEQCLSYFLLVTSLSVALATYIYM